MRRAAGKDNTSMFGGPSRVFDGYGSFEHRMKLAGLYETLEFSLNIRQRSEFIPLRGFVFCKANTKAESARNASGMIN